MQFLLRWGIDMEKRTESILSTAFSIIVGLLGAICLLLFVLKSKNVITNSECQFLVKSLLSAIALLAWVFSIVTKKAPYRGGLADKNENLIEYYIMTFIWFSAFIFFAFMALKK
jgi:hypothetical protein